MIDHPILHRIVSRLYDRPAPLIIEPATAPAAPVLTVDAMSPYPAPARYQFHDGEKYPGGFGFTELLTADYWTLRARSTQLFRSNLYARGVIRRLVRNIINTGLHLEAVPDPEILGADADELAAWSETCENRFALWEGNPALCDHRGLETFGALQAAANMAALVSGDVLVVLHQSAATGLPTIRLVDGSRVQSPFGIDPNLPDGHQIIHGVELDRDGRHVAYWIVSPDDRLERRAQRLPAVGSTGRRLAWLVYGTDKLHGDVRGEPILSLILQSLREIDRYRDAVQRKAAVNAVLALFVKKDQEVMGSRPLTGGAVIRGVGTVGSAQPGGTKRTFNFAEMIPGAVLDELAPGETPQPFSSQGTDERFADFEAAIVYAISWALEIPPEILTLSFKNNYSASQAALNEFKMTLEALRTKWGDSFCQPIYVEWLIAETLAGRIKADGLLESWRDPSQYDRFAAWIAADWAGHVKPSVDVVKQANGYALLVEHGFISRDRAARETTGTKFSKNIAKLKRENAMIAEANAVLREAEQAAAPSKPNLTVVPANDTEEEAG